MAELASAVATESAEAAAVKPVPPLPASVGTPATSSASNAKRRMTARTLEAAMKGQDKQVLSKAIEWAIKTGVQSEAIERARKRMSELRESGCKQQVKKQASQVAAEALEFAMKSTDAAELERAIAQAVEAGVSYKLVERAKRRKLSAGRQQTSDRADAVAALELMTIGTDLDALASTIDWAVNAGVDPALLAPAQRRKAALENEELRRSKLREATAALAAVEDGSSIEALTAAIDLGVQAGANAEMLERARHVRARLEREAEHCRLQAEVTQALQSATEGADMQQLDAAIGRAVYAGVSGDILDTAQKQRAMLQRAAQKQAQEKAAIALQAAVSKSDVVALKMALAQAADAGLVNQLSVEAREKLETLQQVASRRSRKEAATALEKATKWGSLENLTLAIKEAERVGLEAAEPSLELARQRKDLLEEERRRQLLETVRRDLESAAVGCDLEALRTALTAAMRTGVGEGADTGLLWQAKERMAVLEAHAKTHMVQSAAKDAVQSAIGSCDTELIGQAIQRGVELGVDAEVIRKAQNRHAALLSQATSASTARRLF